MHPCNLQINFRELICPSNLLSLFLGLLPLVGRKFKWNGALPLARGNPVSMHYISEKLKEESG